MSRCARCTQAAVGYGPKGRHCWSCAKAISVRPWKVAR